MLCWWRFPRAYWLTSESRPAVIKDFNESKIISKKQQPQQSQEQHSDAEAERLAAHARALGIAIIRDHLEAFLLEHPGASYTEWIANLHPENVTAQGTLDQRFLIPKNTWMVVYKEVLVTNGLDYQHSKDIALPQ